MIVGVAYPYPPYAVDAVEDVYDVLGWPHQHFALQACRGLADRFYVLTSRPEVRAEALACGYTVMPWERLEASQGLLPGHRMTNAMMDFIREDLGVDYETLMRRHFLHMNLANALVRRETLLAMREAAVSRGLPFLYLAVRLREALGVVGAEGAMVSVLNDAPLAMEEGCVPPLVRYDHATRFSCEGSVRAGLPRHFVHPVSELEALRVDGPDKARLASFILGELPGYHLEA